MYPLQLLPIKLDYLCFLSNRCHDGVVFQPVRMHHFKELKLDSMILPEFFSKINQLVILLQFSEFPLRHQPGIGAFWFSH